MMRRNAHIVILRGGISEQEGLLFRWRKVSRGTPDSHLEWAVILTVITSHEIFIVAILY
jgi:hypothetical protein